MISSVEATHEAGIVALVTVLIGDVLVAPLASSVPPVICEKLTCAQVRVPSWDTSETY
jgi:hypothetical protein